MQTSKAIDYSPYVRISYREELRQLPDTYRRAMALDVSAYAQWLRSVADRPLLAVGAGGSLPVAQLACALHERATGQLARTGEPLDLFLPASQDAKHAALLVTASGSHSDSLAACAAIPGHSAEWAVFCGKLQSRGAALLEGTSVPVFEYDLLPELHGWIAVNALLGQAVVTARAYGEAFGDVVGPLPATFEELLPGGAPGVDDAIGLLTETFGEVLRREKLIFLYGPETKGGALDLDSKYAESGLGDLVLSEYRNFAHGRYQMILPVQESCGVAAIYSDREAAIAERSLAVFPEHIPAAGVLVPGATPAATQVAGLLSVLLLVDVIGAVRGVTPGWGSRDTFGDVLYELDLMDLFDINAK